MRTSGVLFAICIAIASSVPAQTPKQPSATVPEVHKLFLEDQKDRGVGGESLPWEQLDARDKARRARVHELLDSGALKTGEDFHDAAFIYQHGHDVNDYLLAHVLAVIAIAKGHTDSRWISAATLDRYLQSMKQPQVFGTQYFQADEKAPYTQEPYNRQLLPDFMRAQFCVPSMDVQKKNVEVFSAGKYPEQTPIPGCSCNR